MGEKVVFLAFKNEKIEPEGRDFLACTHCRNKTYTMVYQGNNAFLLAQCAACGNHIGYVGWAEKPGESSDNGNGEQK